jgi:hypothetical protein
MKHHYILTFYTEDQAFNFSLAMNPSLDVFTDGDKIYVASERFMACPSIVRSHSKSGGLHTAEIITEQEFEAHTLRITAERLIAMGVAERP